MLRVSTQQQNWQCLQGICGWKVNKTPAAAWYTVYNLASSVPMVQYICGPIICNYENYVTEQPYQTNILAIGSNEEKRPCTYQSSLVE